MGHLQLQSVMLAQLEEAPFRIKPGFERYIVVMLWLQFTGKSVEYTTEEAARKLRLPRSWDKAKTGLVMKSAAFGEWWWFLFRVRRFLVLYVMCSVVENLILVATFPRAQTAIILIWFSSSLSVVFNILNESLHGS
jgi:hypothetical protein